MPSTHIVEAILLNTRENVENYWNNFQFLFLSLPLSPSNTVEMTPTPLHPRSPFHPNQCCKLSCMAVSQGQHWSGGGEGCTPIWVTIWQGNRDMPSKQLKIGSVQQILSVIEDTQY